MLTPRESPGSPSGVASRTLADILEAGEKGCPPPPQPTVSRVPSLSGKPSTANYSPARSRAKDTEAGPWFPCPRSRILPLPLRLERLPDSPSSVPARVPGALPCLFQAERGHPPMKKPQLSILSPGPSFRVAARVSSRIQELPIQSCRLGVTDLMAEESGSRNEGCSGPESTVRPGGCWSRRLLVCERQMLPFQNVDCWLNTAIVERHIYL